jgi:hypothetical protein
MRRLQLARSTSATPRAASLLLNRRTCIGGFGSAIAMTVPASADPRLATAESEGWTVWHGTAHSAFGMMTLMKDEGSEDPNDNPLASRAAYAR